MFKELSNVCMRHCFLAVVLVGGLSCSTSAAEVVLGDFTKNDNGWRVAHHARDVEVSTAGTSFTVTSNDPWILGPKVAIPAAAEGTTKVRFTITCAPTTCGGAWEIYHDLEGKGYDERKKFALRACGHEPYTRFSVDMPVKGFSSVSGSFRIDPPASIGERFTIKSFTAEIVKPMWSYRPAPPPALTLPADSIVLEGEGWCLRHDPSRMGAFRYESHGKTVEGCVGEACVVAWPDTESRLVLTRIGSVSSVTLNGKPLAFRHDAARCIAVVTLPVRATGSLEIKL